MSDHAFIAALNELGLSLSEEQANKYMALLRRGCGFLVNHSCRPNLAIHATVCKTVGDGCVAVLQLKALRDIAVRSVSVCLHLFACVQPRLVV